MTNAHRDLAAPEHWTRSLERSRRRRELLPKGRREWNRRKHISAALATAVVAGPSTPLAAAQVSGSGDLSAAVAAESPANRAIEIREGGLPLQVGSQGDLVAHVQKALKVTADGVFGAQTDAAVRSYQARAGLEVDGIVGLATWGSLFEQNTASGAAVGGSNIPPKVRERVEAKLEQAGRDLAVDGQIDGDAGVQSAPAPQGPTAQAAPPVTGSPESRTDTQTQTTTPAPTGEACGSSTVSSPVRGTVTSNFGPRWGRNHNGIDIAAPTGTPVRAAACGTVSLAGQQSGYGNMVCITHTSQFSTCYAHLSRFGVSSGAQVRQGQVIGYVGCTGSCTGPHLHFETRVGGQAQDPRTYLRGGSIPGKASASTSSTSNVGGPDLPPELLERPAGGEVTAEVVGGGVSATTQTAPGTSDTGTVGYETVTTSDGTVTAGNEVATETGVTAPETVGVQGEFAAPAEPVAVEVDAAVPAEPVAVETAVEAAPAAEVAAEPVAVETAPAAEVAAPAPAPAEPVAVEAAAPVADVPVEAAPAAPSTVEAAPAADVAAPDTGVDATAAVSGGVVAE